MTKIEGGSGDNGGGVMQGVCATGLDGKGGRRRVAAARAVRTLRLLRRLGISAKVVGSLAEGRFSQYSDVDFLILQCPHNLKYAIEGRVEDVMRDIPFDVVYRDEIKERILRRMEESATDACGIMKVIENNGQWHKAILTRMRLPYGDKRPAVLSSELRQRSDEA